MGPGLWFELEIDGTPCHMKYLPWFAIAYDTMFRWWWIQLKPGDLTLGEHTFIGRWYANYALDLEITITVTVIP